MPILDIDKRNIQKLHIVIKDLGDQIKNSPEFTEKIKSDILEVINDLRKIQNLNKEKDNRNYRSLIENIELCRGMLLLNSTFSKILDKEKYFDIINELFRIKINISNSQKKANPFLSQIHIKENDCVIDESIHTNQKLISKLEILKFFIFYNFNISSQSEDYKKLLIAIYQRQQLNSLKYFGTHTFFLNALFYSYKNILGNENYEKDFEKFLDHIFEEQDSISLQDIKFNPISNKIWKLIDNYNQKFSKSQHLILSEKIENKILNLSIHIFSIAQESLISSSSGTIFEIDKKNNFLYIKTNKHCVTDKLTKNKANTISIKFLNQKLPEESRVFKISKENVFLPRKNDETDLAFIRIKIHNLENFFDINLKKNDHIKQNETVISAGNSYGLYSGSNKTNITIGRIIDRGYQSFDYNKNRYYYPKFTHSCPTWSGNSGGGLFDQECNLIGINQSNDNLGTTAISISKVKKVFSQIPEIEIEKLQQENQQNEEFIKKAKDNNSITNSEIANIEKEKTKNQIKIAKHSFGFIIMDVSAGIAIYFSFKKLIEENKISNKFQKNLCFGLIGAFCILIFFLEYKKLLNDHKIILKNQNDIDSLYKIIKDNDHKIACSNGYIKMNITSISKLEKEIKERNAQNLA